MSKKGLIITETEHQCECGNLQQADKDLDPGAEIAPRRGAISAPGSNKDSTAMTQSQVTAVRLTQTHFNGESLRLYALSEQAGYHQEIIGDGSALD